ncbi:MAG TPA: glycosyltransferase family 2 protein [Xanthomonadaceae bacterium]|nr:glycosyltransferase family 2 protein [Xanthomonadaceae bacterium]
MSCLVSILIPAYKAEKWIRETMSSAIHQTWPNKEVIVVDDGSPDHTFEVAKSLESRFVKVVKQANTGACGARNKALSLAQGDYIQWLDADDLLHPEKISHQLAKAEDGSNSLSLLTSAWGKFFFRPQKAKFDPDPLWRDLSPVDWIMTKFNDNAWMNPAVWLVSRRLAELAGPWDERLTSSGDDDGEYICRVVTHARDVKFVRDAKCYYRIGTVGSLNWNMERSEKSLNTLILSLSLSIGHLRSLEDTARTRTASINYLQTFLPYFYGNESLLKKLYDMAEELGGTLNPPKVNWKYRPIEMIFGPNVTKKVINNWRAAKLLARGNWDRLLLNLTG